MRLQILISSFLLVQSFAVAAQTNSGKVIYSKAQQIEFDEHNLEGMTDEQKAMIKKRVMHMGHQKKVLLFSAKASLFRDFIPEKDGKMEPGHPGEQHMMMMRPRHIVFHQYQPDTVIQQREAFGKKFLIKGREKPLWKFTGSQDTVLGTICQQARSTIDSTTIVVSFAPAYPVPSGPSTFFGLPGLVLRAVINDGDVVYEAVRIDALTEENAATIAPPDKGKEVTREEFEAIMAEKRKEMEEMYGKQGNRHMEIRMGH